MDNDPLQRIRIARDSADVALSKALLSQLDHGPDLQADGLVGVLANLLDIISDELPKLDRLLNPFHD